MAAQRSPCTFGKRSDSRSYAHRRAPTSDRCFPTYDDGTGDRLTRSRMTWPDGYAVSYQYDALNRLTTQIDSDGIALATRTYDNVARPATLQYPFANDNVAYSWSPQDELITLTNNLAQAANDVSFVNSFTPAHQIGGATISNAAFKYSPPSGGADLYPAANALNQYASVTPNGGPSRCFKKTHKRPQFLYPRFASHFIHDLPVSPLALTAKRSPSTSSANCFPLGDRLS